MCRCVVLAAFVLCLPLQAAAMNKCVSPEGRVTYTSDPCPDNAKSATALKLKGVAPARADTAEDAFFSARSAFEAGPEAYAKHLDPPPTGEAFLAFQKVYDFMKQMQLRDYRIVDRQESRDGNTVQLKVNATGRNPITGAQGAVIGDVTLLRKSGRWVIDTDKWNFQAGS